MPTWRAHLDPAGTADDFLPVLIYVVLRANVPRLHSMCEYVQAFHSPVALMSRWVGGWMGATVGPSGMVDVGGHVTSRIIFVGEHFNRLRAKNLQSRFLGQTTQIPSSLSPQTGLRS